MDKIDNAVDSFRVGGLLTIDDDLSTIISTCGSCSHKGYGELITEFIINTMDWAGGLFIPLLLIWLCCLFMKKNFLQIGTIVSLSITIMGFLLAKILLNYTDLLLVILLLQNVVVFLFVIKRLKKEALPIHKFLIFGMLFFLAFALFIIFSSFRFLLS